MAKPDEKKKAREMRRNGQSIKSIAKKLMVSPSSVSVWCNNIKLTQAQIEKLERQGRDPHYGRRLGYALDQQKKRKRKTERLKKQGIDEIGQLSERELFVTGVVLYWAEGFKKDSQAGLASSDPEMIKVFLRWLKVCCDYDNEDLSLRVTANISHKYRIEEIEIFWAKELNIPRGQFQKPYFQRVKWKKTYENPDDYFGVLRIRVRKSTDFLRKIHGWIAGLKKQV